MSPRRFPRFRVYSETGRDQTDPQSNGHHRKFARSNGLRLNGRRGTMVSPLLEAGLVYRDSSPTIQRVPLFPFPSSPAVSASPLPPATPTLLVLRRRLRLQHPPTHPVPPATRGHRCPRRPGSPPRVASIPHERGAGKTWPWHRRGYSPPTRGPIRFDYLFSHFYLVVFPLDSVGAPRLQGFRVYRCRWGFAAAAAAPGRTPAAGVVETAPKPTDLPTQR